MAEILAAIKLLWEIICAAKELAAFIEKNKEEKWFQDSAALFGRWKDAKTPEQKKDLVRGIGDVWGRV